MKTESAFIERVFIPPLLTAYLNRTDDVTPAEILQSETFKTLTEVQAAEIAQVIKEFACIVFEAVNAQVQAQPKAPAIKLKNSIPNRNAA